MTTRSLRQRLPGPLAVTLVLVAAALIFLTALLSERKPPARFWATGPRSALRIASEPGGDELSGFRVQGWRPVLVSVIGHDFLAVVGPEPSRVVEFLAEFGFADGGLPVACFRSTSTREVVLGECWTLYESAELPETPASPASDVAGGTR